MNLFIQTDPPTSTAQMKKVTVRKGKPVFYEPDEVKKARMIFTTFLASHKPDRPFEGAVSLYVLWLFPKGKNHKNGEWHTTRPDTDNLQKLLKDCMTAVGFWKDDSQVAQEIIEKRWSDEPCGIYIAIENLKEVAENVQK